MSIDDVPADFAPYHVVRTDGPIASGCGRFYDVGHAFDMRRFLERHFPEHTYVVVHDGGILSDPAEAKPHLKILKKAA